MIEVPVSWVSYYGSNPERGRWDQAWIKRLLDGEEWRVPGGLTFVDVPWEPDDGRGRVIVFPCGSYADNGITHVALRRLREDVAELPWALIIATSDEGSTFPWHDFDVAPNDRLWVMTPRVDHAYPAGTFFIGEGSPTPASEFVKARFDDDKKLDVFFSGQMGHERRAQMCAALETERINRDDLTIVTNYTEAFASGFDLDVYVELLGDTKVAPCPSGPLTQDSFRFYEALEAGAIPIVDNHRPGDDNGAGYWEMIFPDGTGPFPHIDQWPQIHPLVLHSWARVAARTSAWWQQYKRSVAYRLDRDVFEMIAPTVQAFGAADRITVLMPTSPVPSNPSTDIIEATIRSVQDRLPGAEIHILIDGVRDEQADRADDYWEYARRLCANVNADPTIVPYVHERHMHQSGMTREALKRVTTPYIMFVEHDTPLVGDIDFGHVLRVMEDDEVASMRFLHETHVIPEAEHLFLPREDDEPYLRTVQWSQRPHVARTGWYRDVMATFFGTESRTMIEDQMHGIAQHNHVGSTKRLLRGWEEWRMAVWAPPGDSIKFSDHLDGRAGDPKFPVLIAYDNGRPEGAPPEGWMNV